MRHTLTAQVLALAVKNLYPTAKLAIGPTIENGFYYDFYFDNSFSIDDLDNVEKEMHNIIKTQSTITKSLLAKNDAIKLFNGLEESFKAEVVIPFGPSNILKLRIFETMSIIDCEVSSCSTQTKTRHPGPIEEKFSHLQKF